MVVEVVITSVIKTEKLYNIKIYFKNLGWVLVDEKLKPTDKILSSKSQNSNKTFKLVNIKISL